MMPNLFPATPLSVFFKVSMPGATVNRSFGKGHPQSCAALIGQPLAGGHRANCM
jgi:hypothetical protein